MKMFNHLSKGLAVAAVLMATAAGAGAAIVDSLYLGNRTPLRDVLERPVQGTWGDDPAECARIEIREVGAGIVAPNPITGESDNEANPLFIETRMGENAVGRNPGRFSVVLPNRLQEGVLYFARVLDPVAPYFADSEPFQAPTTTRKTQASVDVVFQEMRLISGGDDVDSDGDGVPDAMELAMGMDPDSPDSRGDGWDDLLVLMLGDYLNPTNANWIEIAIDTPSIPANSPARQDADLYFVSWWSIPGIWYRLEYRTAALDDEDDEGAWEEVWTGMAEEDELAVNIDELLLEEDDGTGFFRVWAMPYYEP
jgi:hypothetical protein